VHANESTTERVTESLSLSLSLSLSPPTEFSEAEMKNGIDIILLSLTAVHVAQKKATICLAYDM
jgi:hypothetical protein